VVPSVVLPSWVHMHSAGKHNSGSVLRPTQITSVNKVHPVVRDNYWYRGIQSSTKICI
jgi:hypothetical protein